MSELFEQLGDILNPSNIEEDLRQAEIEAPRFTHDCDVCKYLGRYEEYDLYFCKREPTVIGRFSSTGRDYTSGMCFAVPGVSKPLYEAKQRAIKLGLIQQDDDIHTS